MYLFVRYSSAINNTYNDCIMLLLVLNVDLILLFKIRKIWHLRRSYKKEYGIGC